MTDEAMSLDLRKLSIILPRFAAHEEAIAAMPSSISPQTRRDNADQLRRLAIALGKMADVRAKRLLEEML